MVMIYPQLVQYGPGLKFRATGRLVEDVQGREGLDVQAEAERQVVGREADDRRRRGLDDQHDREVRRGPTALLATVLAHVKNATAPNPNTLVVHYQAPVGNVLPQLEQFFILPQHVWQKFVGTNGKGLKTYHPELHLPIVTGGAYTITQYEKKGTTAFKPDPNFYGPKSNSAGVALTYYTNADAVIADLKRGTSTGPTRSRSRRSTPSRRTRTSSSPRSRAPRRRTSPGTRTPRSRRTVSSSARP